MYFVCFGKLNTARQLCGITLHSSIFFQTTSSHPNFKTWETFIFTSRLKCLKCGLVRYCLKKIALFKHNTVDTLLGWFHTFGEQCMCMYVCVSWHMKIPFLLLLFHFDCNACSSNETQCYHSYQFWLRCNRATSLCFLVFRLGLCCCRLLSVYLRATSISVQSHYCSSACGES